MMGKPLANAAGPFSLRARAHEGVAAHSKANRKFQKRKSKISFQKQIFILENEKLGPFRRWSSCFSLLSWRQSPEQSYDENPHSPATSSVSAATSNHDGEEEAEDLPDASELKLKIKTKLQLNGDSDCSSSAAGESTVNGNSDKSDSNTLALSNMLEAFSNMLEALSNMFLQEDSSDAEKNGTDSDDSGSGGEGGGEKKKKQYTIFSDEDEDDLENYECGQSTPSEKDSDYEQSEEQSEDDDDDENYPSDSEEEVFQRKKRSNRKNRYWEGNEEMYGIRRSGRDRKANARYLDDSDGSGTSGGGGGGRAAVGSDDDSAAFFKQKPKKRGNKNFRKLSESDGSENSDYSPSEDMPFRRSATKKKKFRRIKRIARSPTQSVYRETRVGRKQINYKDVEEMDPIGSEDENDIIYKEEQPVEPEEPSEKIEKVIQHRTGPKVGDQTAMSAGGKGLRCLEDVPGPGESRIMQYFIKWANYSHIHNTWETKASLENKDCKGMKILENYQKKNREIDAWKRSQSPEDLEYMEMHEEMKLNLAFSNMLEALSNMFLQEDSSDEKNGTDSDDSGSGGEGGGEKKKKQYTIFSDEDEDDLENYECGQSTPSEKDSDYEQSEEQSEDDDDDENYPSDSEEEVFQRKKRSNRKNRYWEGNEEMYGIRRSGRDRKANARYLDDSDASGTSGGGGGGRAAVGSDDDSAAFFKQKPKKRGNKNFR
eukprot:sb/3462560/